MTCDDIQALYLDRDLELPDIVAAGRIADHFNRCQACRQAAGQYDELRGALKAPNDDALDDLTSSELRLPGFEPITRYPNLPRGRYRALQPFVLAATICVALVGWGLYISHRQNHPAGPDLVGPPVRDGHALNDGADERREKGAPFDSDSRPPAALRWTPAEVDRGAAVFTKVSESFDGRAAWVAESDRASDVGLIDGPTAPPPKVLLVRLFMSHAKRSPFKTDLVIVPGQEVSIELPFQKDEVLRYRIKTTPGPQPRLTLAAEVRSVNGGETLAALATQLQPQSGQTLSAGRLLSQTGQYSLDVSFSETTL